jgi:CRISPR-associated protein Cas1
VGDFCKKLVMGKIRNQRSVLLYFSKQFQEGQEKEKLSRATQKIESSLFEVKKTEFSETSFWREQLMGYEGGCAQIYWNALREANLLPSQFEARTGRGAKDVVNQALNFGYSLLMSYIWNAVLKAGLEPYLGFYHVVRPGKPSLILDIMEEYRAWVVDRSVIKSRSLIQKANEFNNEIKTRLIQEVHETFSKKYIFFGKKLKLETMLQRQIYKLCGYIYGSKNYRAISFKW